MSLDYNKILCYVKTLRSHFKRNYPIDYHIGNIYMGDSITYFPFTPTTLKTQKLKLAIVFNHQNQRFEIWLAGQNKQIQKKYWEIFKGSDWNKHHIPDDITNGFSIVDHVLIDKPDFNKPEKLTIQIEIGTMDFIDDIEKVLL